MMVIRQSSIVAMFACFGIFVVPTAEAISAMQPVATEVQRTTDIALRHDGVLAGQLLTAQGRARADETVVLRQRGQEVARVRTNEQGEFEFAALGGGVYEAQANGGRMTCRLWSPGTAPPKAQQGLMLVESGDVVRGQVGCGTPVCGSPTCGSGVGCCRGGIGQWMADHPMLTAGAIGAAIAVPLSIDDDDPPATP